MKTLTAIVRPFADQDYPALVTLYNAVEPEYQTTEVEVRHRDAHREPKIDFRRLVLELGNSLVGEASFWQATWMYHPQKFFVGVEVHPQYRRRGLGTELFEALLRDLRAFQPTVLRARAREDRPASLNFATKYGFVEESRDWESRLDPTTVDFGAYDAVFAGAAAQGVALVTLAELMKTDPDHRRKLFELEAETGADAPHQDEPTKPSFATWQKNFFEHPSFTPETHLVAVKDGRYIGLNSLWVAQDESGGLYNGLTGVRRDWRRRGLATALKLQNLRWAAESGHRQVKTWNSTENTGMLAINMTLGFEKQPAWINLKKDVETEDERDKRP